MIQLNKAYWNYRYDQNRASWDAGTITTPLKEYFDQLDDHDLRILIPGAGNAYEAEYLMNRGFRNVFVLDISDRAISSFKSRVVNFPQNHIYHEDFFDHRNEYDIIVEQTFFCALDPVFRRAYSRKCYDLLRAKGKVVGLLWNHDFGNPEPPYGGSESEYRELFSVHFKIEKLSLAYNSIKPRSGRELFIKLIKK